LLCRRVSVILRARDVEGMDPPIARQTPPRPQTSGKAGTPRELREWAAKISPAKVTTPSETDGDDTIAAPDVDPAEPRRFGIPDGSSAARARMISASRGTGGALLVGFSCESGDLNGRWDKPVGDGLRKSPVMDGVPVPRGQTVTPTPVGAGPGAWFR